MKVTRRIALKSGLSTLVSVGVLSVTHATQYLKRLSAFPDTRVRCTGVAFDGGGLGGPLIVRVTFAPDDNSFQATLILPSDEGFQDGQYYLMSITPD